MPTHEHVVWGLFKQVLNSAPQDCKNAVCENLQDAGELGVPIIDVCGITGHQCIHYVSKRAQGPA